MEQEHLGEMVANQISAMMAYWDTDMICRYANDAYLLWFGIRKEDMVDKMHISEFLGKDLYEKYTPYISAALKGKPQTFERELTFTDGRSPRYLLASYYPHFAGGKVVGLIAHIADVTPVKLLERELVQSLNTIKEQNERLLNFANIVTHNLKSYANNLGTILDMFINARAEGEKAQMLDFLKDISTGFSATIADLTEVVDATNKSTLKKEKVTLAYSIKAAIDILKVDIHRSGATIVNQVSDAIFINTIPAYLDSIVLNLLSNAIKYRHPDRELLINISAGMADGKLLLKVSDNGQGIDLERNKDKLFGMFQTFHGNADAKGIGLYLVRSQAEALGGYIDVESQVGAGATFVVGIEG